MSRRRNLVRLRNAGLIAGAAWGLLASAAPLPPEAAYDEGSTRRASEAEIALRDPRQELLPPEASPGGIQRELLAHAARSHGGHASKEAHGFDLGHGLDSAAHPVGASLQDMLRSLVNVRPGSAPPRDEAAPRPSARPAGNAAGVDIRLASNEWIRESVQEVVTAVLNVHHNERGQTSFSVLGWGDFSVVLAGDRSEVALLAGDAPIVMAQRTAQRSYADGLSHGGRSDPFPDTGAGAGSARADELRSGSLLWQLLDLMGEIASHPLSFLVYALLLGYALVWSLMSGRAQRPLGAAARHRHGRRGASGARAAPMPAASAASPEKRKRIRMRVRVRKYRR